MITIEVDGARGGLRRVMISSKDKYIIVTNSNDGARGGLLHAVQSLGEDRLGDHLVGDLDNINNNDNNNNNE